MQKIIILLFLATNLYLFGQEQYQSTDNMLSTYRKDTSDGYSWRYRENNYDKTKKTISTDKLLSTIWVTDPLEQTQNILVFYKDEIFKLGTRQTGVEITGKYSIDKESNIILNDYNTKSTFLSRTGLSNNTTNCVFQINSNHIIYRDCINLGDKKYYAVGSEHSNGSKIIFNRINVIVNIETKVMNENMKFRETPSIKGTLIKVYQYGEISSKEITSLKKGTIVYLLAKTENEEIIDGIKSSWYFIKVYDGYEWYQYGWVFGGYFADYDKNKEKDYWNIVVEELKK